MLSWIADIARLWQILSRPLNAPLSTGATSKCCSSLWRLKLAKVVVRGSEWHEWRQACISLAPSPEGSQQGHSQIGAPLSGSGKSETMMEYTGYIGKVQIDEAAGLLHGEVINIRDVVTFERRTVEELRQAFEASVEDFIWPSALNGVKSPTNHSPENLSSACLLSCIAKLPSKRNWPTRVSIAG